MEYSVVMVVNEGIESIIRNHWKRMFDFNLSTYHLDGDKFPHITYLSFDTKNSMEQVIYTFKNEFSKLPKYDFNVEGIESFGVSKAIYFAIYFPEIFYKDRLFLINKVDNKWHENSGFKYISHLTIANYLEQSKHKKTLEFLENDFISFKGNINNYLLISINQDKTINILSYV
ncbi:hypothetical protein BG261_01825 [Floricoccus tropicus]|uniref:2'-5' RNA ligase n=1 Tax=Floricoccus tropicus TaxID=1859473 RepID=A0A1E8GMV0_9LACT|nr:hypothetical protein [Floricoccus tropicus]OFI49346.1 hypothetical protein BG261_01825 [Floricoccus tropicus]